MKVRIIDNKYSLVFGEKGKTMKKILMFCILMSVLAICGPADAVLLSFEDLTLGDTYTVGQSFTTNGVQMTVVPLQNGGQPGSVKVVNYGAAVGFDTGYELEFDDAALEINLNGCPDCFATFLFGEYSGKVNFGFNTNLFILEDFDNWYFTLGGAQGFSASRDDYLGMMYFFSTTNVDSLTIGGENLYIDNLSVCEIPEPTTIALLGFGAIGLLARRKR